MKVVIPNVCGIFYDNDGCVEIIFRNDIARLLLFWPPAFSLFIGRYVIMFRVMNKFFKILNMKERKWKN